MDGGSESNTFGQAGYAITGSGGGGAEGQYVFADLVELDAIIAEWEALRDEIRGDGRKLVLAQQLIEPPGEDIMSQLEAKATVRSLDKAQIHNDAMAAYADGYVTKLRAARAEYANTDEASAAHLRGVDGG